MREIVSPAKAIQGIVSLPGDKSISHRYGMLAANSRGRQHHRAIIRPERTANRRSAAWQALGARIERDETDA